MTTVEKTGATEPQVLHTAMPDVTVQDIDEADLPDVKQLFENNLVHASKGGIVPDEVLYKRVLQDVAEGNGSTSHRMEIRFQDKLVGYIGLVPSEISYDPHDVELSYFVDKEYVKKGIAKAAVGAIVAREDSTDHNVIAVVNQNNAASVNLLKGVGLEQKDIDDDMRLVFARKALITNEMLQKFGMM